MYLRRLSDAPAYERDGLRSHVLLDAGEFGSEHLVITWVEVPPGAQQRPHAHNAAEQTYVIVRGAGRMTVGDDEEAVGEGDVVFVPPQTSHSISNDGDHLLIYASATSPPESMAELYRTDLA